MSDGSGSRGFQECSNSRDRHHLNSSRSDHRSSGGHNSHNHRLSGGSVEFCMIHSDHCTIDHNQKISIVYLLFVKQEVPQ